MDLPLHPSVDIYQIHRTPFFRLLHRRDSDEFERLKQAYNSVRNFDEKPLVAQVKKIRLGKLLRRIKDTLSSRASRENQPRPPLKTKHEIRREELAKARQMGIDYSRQNTANIPMSLITAHERVKHDPLMGLKNEKYRLQRRLEYGNKKSKVNRTKIQRSLTLNGQRSADIDVNALGVVPELLSSSPTRLRLHMMQKNMPKKDFMKFLVQCLSTENPSSDIMKTFEEILQSKNDLYWDLVEALNIQEQYIKRYAQSMKKLSNLAVRGLSVSAPSSSHPRYNDYAETFQSKTNLKPPALKTPEIFIRTYRYSDEDEFLPAPLESLLSIPEDMSQQTEEIPERDCIHETQTIESSTTGAASSHISKDAPNQLSAKLFNSLGLDTATKNAITHKFGDIIRDAVRRESLAMLPNLAKAMKH